jgi:hypothetical protein
MVMVSVIFWGEKFRQNVKKRKKEKKKTEEIFCHNNPAFSDEKIIKYP